MTNPDIDKAVDEAILAYQEACRVEINIRNARLSKSDATLEARRVAHEDVDTARAALIAAKKAQVNA
jgi:hypothetical protein